MRAAQLLQGQENVSIPGTLIGLAIAAVAALLLIVIGQLVLFAEGIEHGLANCRQSRDLLAPTTGVRAASAWYNARRKVKRLCRLFMWADCRAVSWRLSEKAITLRWRAGQAADLRADQHIGGRGAADRTEGEQFVELTAAAVMDDRAGRAEQEGRRDKDGIQSVMTASSPLVFG